AAAARGQQQVDVHADAGVLAAQVEAAAGADEEVAEEHGVHAGGAVVGTDLVQGGPRRLVRALDGRRRRRAVGVVAPGRVAVALADAAAVRRHAVVLVAIVAGAAHVGGV